MTYADFKAFDDKASSRGEIGVVATGVGVACVIGGIVWYATHEDHPRESAISGWIAPTGGGLAITRGF